MIQWPEQHVLDREFSQTRTAKRIVAGIVQRVAKLVSSASSSFSNKAYSSENVHLLADFHMLHKACP
eukprot:scaffold402579_cov51-Prasinocladus_malaysianus.AAC.1